MLKDNNITPMRNLLQGRNTVNTGTTVNKIKTNAAQHTRKAVNTPVVEGLARAGYIARGVVYALIGLLAAQLAFSSGGKITDQQGAIQMLGAQPFGKILLILVAIGLVGYAMWGVIRAVLDPLGRGSDTKGLVERAGFLLSGITYGALAVVAFNAGTGVGKASGAGNPQDMSAQLLSKPYGPWLVGILGLFWIGAGVGQLYTAWKADFKKDLKPNLPASEKLWSERLGRVGYAARGIVFLLIGWFTIQAALTVNPNQAVGFDGALLKLAQQPYGIFLLGIVALGLLCFGIYSMLCARWMRILPNN
jgi:hypothetical protein